MTAPRKRTLNGALNLTNSVVLGKILQGTPQHTNPLVDCLSGTVFLTPLGLGAGAIE